MTQEFLQEALVADLKTLFQGYVLKNSAGMELPVQVYPQDLPFRAGADIEPAWSEDELSETGTPEAVPEPYIIVRLIDGELPEPDERQKVSVILVMCVYDEDPNRQGFRDLMHIVNTVMLHYGANSIVGRRYEVQCPIKWAVQDGESHPYYFAAVALNFAAPEIFKEVPEA